MPEEAQGSGVAPRRGWLRPEWIWAVAVVLLVGFAVGWIPTPRHEGRSDSYSTSPEGKKFFVDLLRESGVSVRRHASALVPASPGASDKGTDGAGRGQTLLILGPARYPRPEEWRALHAWVARGNTLVFAARYADPVVDLAPFPVQVARGAATLSWLKRFLSGSPGSAGRAKPRAATPRASTPRPSGKPRDAGANASAGGAPTTGGRDAGVEKKPKEQPPSDPLHGKEGSGNKRKVDLLGLLARAKPLPVRTALADAKQVRWFSRGIVLPKHPGGIEGAELGSGGLGGKARPEESDQKNPRLADSAGGEASPDRDGGSQTSSAGAGVSTGAGAAPGASTSMVASGASGPGRAPGAGVGARRASGASTSTVASLASSAGAGVSSAPARGAGAGEGPRFETLVNAKPGPQAVRVPVGLGRIVVVATDRPFSNIDLVRRSQTWKVAWGLLAGSRRPGKVIVDEYLNRTGTPQGMALLFDPAFRPITLQLLLCVVLFAWAGSRRFGPPAPPIAPPRRSIVEHAVALGNLEYRARAAAHAVRAYLEWWRQEMRMTGSARRQARQVARIAHRSGWTPDAVMRLVSGAQEVGARGGSPGQASGILRQLAALRQAAQVKTTRGRRPSEPAEPADRS